MSNEQENVRRVADAIRNNLWAPDGSITILNAARAAIEALEEKRLPPLTSDSDGSGEAGQTA